MKRSRAGRMSALALTSAVAVSLLVPPMSAVAGPLVTVEGEDPTAVNFTPSYPADAGASGGEYLLLATTTAPPSGGYTVEYTLSVPTGGIYALSTVVTPPTVGWASAFTLTVNGDSTGVPSYRGAVSGLLTEWDHGVVELVAGANAIVFTVTAPRTDDAVTYLLGIDKLSVTKVDAVLKVEGEAATATTFTPGVTSSPGSSGDSFLLLDSAAEPTTSYSANYQFLAHEAGWYELTSVMAPPVATWASPVEVAVNGGTPIPVTQTILLNPVSDLLGQYRLGYIELAAGLNTVSVAATARREAPDDHYLVIIDSVEIEPAVRTVIGFEANGPYNVLEEGDAGNEVKLSLNVPAAVATTVDWEIRDYNDAVVDSGSEPLAANGRSVTIDASALPVGYFQVSAEVASAAVKTSSAIAVVPALASRPDLGDTPFALDVAGAWLIPAADQADFAQVIGLSGVSWIRDRMKWNDSVNPAANTFNFSADAAAEAFTTLVAAQGVSVLGMYQDSPTWTHDSGETLPDDLFAVYEYTKLQAGQFAGRVQAWEVFNETDHTFTGSTEAADRYSAVLKAAAIGYRDSGEDVLVSSAGMAWARDAYGDLFGANETFGYTDIFNYHAHRLESDAAVPALPNHGDAWRDLIDEHSAEQQVWLSEAGMALTSDPITGPTLAQQKALARYIVTSAVQSLASGNDRHFFFVAAPYREAGAEWGMFTGGGEPMPGFVAESVMTLALGEAQYVGPLAGAPAGVTAHTFRDGGDLVTVAWSDTSSTQALPLGAASATLTTIMGTTSTISPALFTTNYSVAVGPTPVYLRYDDPGSGSADVPHTAAALTAADRIIVMPDFGTAASTDAKKSGYALSYEGATAVGVDVYNFGTTTMVGDLVSSSTGGWEFDDARVPISVPAMSKISVPVEVTAGAGVDFSETGRLSFRAEFPGKDSTASVAAVHPVLKDAVIEHVVIGGQHAVRLTYTNTSGSLRTLSEVTVAVGNSDDQIVVGEELAVDESVIVDIPLPATTGSSTQYTLTLDFLAGPNAVYTGTVATPGIGSLLKVGAYNPAAVSPSGFVNLTTDATVELPGHGGPSDLGGTVVFSHDGAALYVNAVIDDNTFAQPYDGSAIWQADSIQVAVSRGLPGESSTIAEFASALTPSGPQAYLFQTLNPAGSAGAITTGSVAVTRDEVAHTTTYALTIPWDVLLGSTPPPGAALGLSILVNDSDGSTRRGYIEWGTGIADSKSPVAFKGVYLGT